MLSLGKMLSLSDLVTALRSTELGARKFMQAALALHQQAVTAQAAKRHSAVYMLRSVQKQQGSPMARLG